CGDTVLLARITARGVHEPGRAPEKSKNGKNSHFSSWRFTDYFSGFHCLFDLPARIFSVFRPAACFSAIIYSQHSKSEENTG
ncbi:MAG TPA: hypothetical protein PLN99_15875, partial [Daejeonella sp.]|nr:hypothetical protein [Daejeonella sp.]